MRPAMVIEELNVSSAVHGAKTSIIVAVIVVVVVGDVVVVVELVEPVVVVDLDLLLPLMSASFLRTLV